MNKKTAPLALVLSMGATALTGQTALAQSAAAESAKGPTLEEVVVTATRGSPTVDGAITAEQVNKTRSTITQEFINTQASGQTVLQSEIGRAHV